MNIIKKNYKKILFLFIAIYAISVFTSQQKMLNTYRADIKAYEEKKEAETQTKEELLAMKENLTSTEYIEKVAREKLGMYLPNERVYIDIAK